MKRNIPEGMVYLGVHVKEEYMDDLKAIVFWTKRTRQQVVEDMFKVYLNSLGYDPKEGPLKSPKK